MVLLDQATEGQNEAFVAYVREQQAGWWHWTSRSFLLYTNLENMTADSVRDALLKFYPGVNNLVIELRGNEETWAGYGPKTDQKNMFKWIGENWKRD